MDRDAVLDWLLEEDSPPVRLLTLTRLLHRAETDAEVQETRARLMDYSVTQGILAQSDTFLHSGGRAFWTFKGQGWNTVFLGHFRADGHDPRIAVGVRELLKHPWVGDKLYCRTVSMLTAFRRLGYGDHPVVIEGTEALARRLLDDVGLTCYPINNGLLSRCYMVLPKLLLCFGEVPPDCRSPAIEAAIEWIARELEDHEVYIYLPGNNEEWQVIRKQLPTKRADLPEGETRQSWTAKTKARFLAEHGVGELQPKTGWTRFGFPLNYNSDILEAMVALSTAGTPMSDALEKPLQVVRDKRTDDGVWILEKSLNGQMWVDVEVKGQPSKWITFFALMVLDHFEC